jgi:hypothetical protein
MMNPHMMNDQSPYKVGKAEVEGKNGIPICWWNLLEAAKKVCDPSTDTAQHIVDRGRLSWAVKICEEGK